MNLPDFSHIVTHKIRGRMYRLLWRKPYKCDGRCESPDRRYALCPVLTISPKQSADDMLGTVIHECAHGAFFDMDEIAIAEFEKDTMRLLHRMGIEVTFNSKKRCRNT